MFLVFNIFLVSFSLNAILGQTDLCDDIDSQVCQIFMQERPHMCTDPCLSKLCPRTCGTCPLKCYKCQSVGLPEQCNQTTICPSGDHYCIESQSFTTDFKLFYNLGCAHKDVCAQVFGSGQLIASGIPIIGKRQTGLQGECCQRDLCNHHRPGTEPITESTTQVPIPTNVTAWPSRNVSTNVSANTICADINTQACLLLSTKNKALCNDLCIVNACPRTCGKCSECYACSHVTRPEDCNNTVNCLSGEKCYVLETLSTEGDHGYRVGCMHQNACDRFHAKAGQIFGKRGDNLELSLKGDCCQGDMCNHKELLPAPSACTYGSILHHCPIGYYLIDGKCYHVGSTALAYNDAQAYCKSNCGMLAERMSLRDANTILHFLAKIVHKDSGGVGGLLIAARDKQHNGVYTWETSGGTAFRDTNSHGNYCAKIDYPVHSRFTETRCDYKHPPLCQASVK